MSTFDFPTPIHYDNSVPYTHEFFGFACVSGIGLIHRIPTEH